MAGKSIELANTGGSFSRFLCEELALRSGLGESLSLTPGFDSRIDEELGSLLSSRLNTSRSRYPEGFGPAPADAHIHFLEAAPIERLIRAGTWAEDNPNARARHHFHDPAFTHNFPPGNRGLDDPPGFPGDTLLGEYVTYLLRGGDRSRWMQALLLDPTGTDPTVGNFEYRGRSAIDRVLNRPLSGSYPSDEAPRNLFALPDAERYLYRALTAQGEVERESFLALHFVSFGHALHLLQDSSSPGHVRNDFTKEHLLAAFSGTTFEGIGDKQFVAESVLRQVGVENDLARETGRDFSALWQGGGNGLTELVQRNVFSSGSLPGDVGLGSDDQYPLPLLPPTCELGAEAGTGVSAVHVAELPERSVFTGGPPTPTVSRSGRFVSGTTIARLGRCGYHAVRGSLTWDGPQSLILADESVQRDYLEFLWPQAIAYGAEMMALYYQRRIHAVPGANGSFRLANATMLPYEINPEAVEIVYQDALRERYQVNVVCTTSGDWVLSPASTPDGLGPVSDFSCQMPSSLPAMPENPDDFWVVVRGRHGERGASFLDEAFPMRASGWKTDDFVVGFEHQQSRLVIMDAVPNPSGNPTTIFRLSQTAVDPINGLGGPTQAALTPPTPVRDLSAEIATGLLNLGSVLLPQLPALTLFVDEHRRAPQAAWGRSNRRLLAGLLPRRSLPRLSRSWARRLRGGGGGGAVRHGGPLAGDEVRPVRGADARARRMARQWASTSRAVTSDARSTLGAGVGFALTTHPEEATRDNDGAMDRPRASPRFGPRMGVRSS